MFESKPFRLAGVLLAAGIAAQASAAPSKCDRECLRSTAQRYLDALVKHDVAAARLADNFRYTENAIDVRPGEGIWKTTTALGQFQRIYVDPVQEQAAYFGLIEEQGQPTIVSLRLRVVDRKITEGELIIGRKGDSLFAPEGLIAHGPSDKPLPRKLRSSRAAMIAAADSYFNGAQSQNPAIVLQRPGCDRYENGVKMTNRAGTGANGVAVNKDCAGTLENSKQIAAVVNRRYPVVDEEAGMVLGTAIFNRPPGAARRDGTLWPRLLLSEFFPIENDRFTAIYAAMFYLPADSKDSGW